MADVTTATTVSESTLIPFIRRQDVFFDADNLRPHKIGRLYLDEVVMNNFAQKGNKIILNSKKNHQYYSKYRVERKYSYK